jgi:hypothetical protein
MQAKAFITGLRALTAVLPYSKRIDDEIAQFIWLSLDQKIKDDVTDEMWAYAVGRRISEEDAPKDMAIHLSALRHVYRCENGRPNLEWGLKPQLSQVMSSQPLLKA